MPIHLDLDTGTITNTGSVSTKKTSPKFFSSKLTGSGKTTGLLSSSLRPNNIPSTSIGNVDISRKTRSSNGGVTMNLIPTAPILRSTLTKAITHGVTIPSVDTDEAFEVTSAATKLDFDVYVDLTPQGLVLRELEVNDKTTRELHVQYRMEVHVHMHALLQNAGVGERTPVHKAIVSRQSHAAMVGWSYEPMVDLPELIEQATARIHPSGKSVYVDLDALSEWMSDYSVFDRLSDQAEIWSNGGIAEQTNHLLKEIDTSPQGYGPEILNAVSHQMRYLESYNVSLDAYRQVHDQLHTSSMSKADIQTMSKQNLNLLMNHSLDDLDNKKPQLQVPPKPANPQALPAHFSPQQRAAICSDDPLNLVQAGAGTGKSTAILGRIDNLIARGVDPQEIMVLSFTNAAADNILAKNPNVKSMTIARMLMGIYEVNHPGHELSTIDTMINSLDIFYPSDDIAREFRRRLMSVLKNDNGSSTALNAYVEMNHDAIIKIMDTIRQTSLELQLMLCYQEIDTMIEPKAMSCKYLIIDEVQDNSIFEFIYTLKYVAKHNLNLFIVGDCSQTLYEFRASNPKALNALEGSGVFTTHQLTTNYRSNQEILDFANVALSDIEANQYAKIQLQANSLALPTAQSFQDAVKLHYVKMSKISEFVDSLPNLLSMYAGEFIQERVDKGEQIAFLCHTRREVAAIEDFLARTYPGKPVANILSEKAYNTTIFSEYIKRHWDEVKQVPPARADFVVTQEIINKLDSMARNADAIRKKIVAMTSEWWTQNHLAIKGWVQQHAAGTMSKDEFFDTLRASLLDFEISKNAARQSLMSQRNNEKKVANLSQNAAFVVSTIHAAKGLEFPHTVALYKHSNDMDESVKRMHYVSLTRAQVSEFVLAYGNVVKAKIDSDYTLMIDALTKRDEYNEKRANGLLDLEDDQDDDSANQALSA